MLNILQNVLIIVVRAEAFWLKIPKYHETCTLDVVFAHKRSTCS